MDPGAVDKIRGQVEEKFLDWRRWVKLNSPSRYTGSYRTVSGDAPVQIKATTAAQLRQTLKSVKDAIPGGDFNKGVIFVSVTAWNDQAGATKQITESKSFEAFHLLRLLVDTTDL